MHASTISSALISHLSLTHSSYLTAFLISTKSHKGKSAVMIRYWNFTLLYFGLSFFQACSFTAQEHIFQRHCHSTKSVGDSFLLARRRKSNDQEDNNNEVKKIPQLPPVTAGGCSSQNNAQSQAAALAASDKQATPAFVSPKFQLQYTCNVCETRNCHLVSRIGT